MSSQEESSAPSGGTGRPSRTRLLLTGLLLFFVGSMVAWLFIAVPPAIDRQDVDFFVLLASGEQLLEGISPYERLTTLGEGEDEFLAHPNLNHPAVIVAMVPLALLPHAVAFALWNLLGAGALLLAIRLVLHELRITLDGWHRFVVIALAISAPGVLYNIYLGQVGLLLTLGMVWTWLLLRRGRWLGAALCLGVLITLKPFLAPVALLFALPQARQGALGLPLGAIAVSLPALPFVGTEGFRAWLGTLSGVDWFAHEFNVGVVGGIERAGLEVSSPVTVWAPLALVLVAVAVMTVRRPDGVTPARLHLVLTVATLLAWPLGWLYYVPVVLPAYLTILRTWRGMGKGQRALAVAAGICLWSPPILQHVLPGGLAWQVTIGSAYMWGVVWMMVALMALNHAATGDEALLTPRTSQAGPAAP